MKTLNEEIQEIKNMKGSKAAKKEAFIKLGLRKYEIELLLSELLNKSERYTSLPLALRLNVW